MSLLGAIYDVLIALFIGLAALGLGWGFLRALGMRAWTGTNLWLAATTGLGLLSVGTMLLGVAGLLYRVVFVALLVPLAIYGCIGLVQVLRQRRGQLWVTWQQWSRLWQVCWSRSARPRCVTV